MKAIINCICCLTSKALDANRISKTQDGQICCPILKCCTKICCEAVKVGVEDNQEVQMSGAHAPEPANMS